MMKTIAQLGVLYFGLMMGCNRSASIFDPPPIQQSAAVIVSSTPAGVDNIAIDSVGYTFSAVAGFTITKQVDASGKVAAVRVEGSAEKTDFKEALAKLRKNEKLSEYRIFYIESSASKAVELK